jgi:diaminopimelate decarboxylase
LNSETRPFISWPGQHGNTTTQELQVDGVSLHALRSAAALPMFVTSLGAVKQRAQVYVAELGKHFRNAKVFYAMKANSADAILREVYAAGCGIDIVSIGEFRAAVAAGVPARDICFAGVGKSRAEILEAFEMNLGIINVEHAEELNFVLETLQERRGRGALGSQSREPLVAVRLNPCVESETHPHLKTGALDSKFGLLAAQIAEWLAVAQVKFTQNGSFDRAKFLDFISPFKGLHVHIGSQLQSHDVFPMVLERVRQVVASLHEAGITITHLDLGGGLGVGMQGVPADASDICKHVAFQAECLKSLVRANSHLQNLWGLECEKLHVCLEPGRSMVASSTVFLSEVLYEKANLESHRFAYVNAGMNAFPRPSIYGAEHATACANRSSESLIPYKIFGPVCESGDVLAREARLPRVAPGDVVVFFEAGAYCRSMASHYNLRTIPAEIFCRDGAIEQVVAACDPTAHLAPGAHPDSFAQVVESRRSVRRFNPNAPIPEMAMRQALSHALLAPNSSNLQMWEFFWVRSPEKKKKLVEACLSQPAASTAAELVVCVARTDTWRANRLRILDVLQKNPKTPAPALKYYEKIVPLSLSQGPLGLGGLTKKIIFTVAGLFRPMPRQPASGADMRVWSVKSTALACENLMLSLKAQGFDSCPMEGFDAVRVRKILGLPRRGAEVVMVVGTGMGVPEGVFGPRLRFDQRFYIREL